MNKQEVIYAKKLELAPLFSSRCYGCRKKFGKGFTYHHIFYYKDGKVYTDEGYHDTIYDEIKKNPSQFLLLCTKCHFIIGMWKKYEHKKFRRLVKAVNMAR